MGTAYYFHKRNAELSHPAAVANPPPAAPPAGSAIENPVPGSPSAAQTPLPALNDSDPAIKDALGAALGNDAMQYLVPESIIRHLVVTIDNLPRQKAPAAKRPGCVCREAPSWRRATSFTRLSIPRITRVTSPW